MQQRDQCASASVDSRDETAVTSKWRARKPDQHRQKPSEEAGQQRAADDDGGERPLDCEPMAVEKAA